MGLWELDERTIERVYSNQDEFILKNFVWALVIFRFSIYKWIAYNTSVDKIVFHGTMNPCELEKFPTLNSFSTQQKEETHAWIQKKIHYSNESAAHPHTFHNNISFFDCRLFPWQHMSPQFRRLYTEAVQDKNAQEDLEKCGALNWCPQLATMKAVAVPRDGNCLLHAASMAMWSVEDEKCTLRELLLLAFSSNKNNSYKHRWWRQKLLDLKALQDGSKPIDEEWEAVVSSIGALGSQSPNKAKFQTLLESIHIYVLSNILRRPIIIVAAGMNQSQSGYGQHCQNFSDSHIAGIYLPLEWRPLKCCKTPLILGYSRGHFCPLLAQAEVRSTNGPLHFPLVTQDFCSLPVRYLSQQEEHCASELVQSYFRVREVSVSKAGPGSSSGDGKVSVPCCVLQQHPLPVEHDQIQRHFQACEGLALSRGADWERRSESGLDRQAQHMQAMSQTRLVESNRSFSEAFHAVMGSPRHRVELQPHLQSHELTVQGPPPLPATMSRFCITQGCHKEGMISQGNLCDSCFKNYTIAEAGAELVSLGEGSNRTFTIRQSSSSPAPPSPGKDVAGQMLSLSDLEQTLPVQRSVSPTAPPTSHLEVTEATEPALSMMEVRCSNGCGYRCSRNTYPYCHECHDLLKQPSRHESSPTGSKDGRQLGKTIPGEGILQVRYRLSNGEPLVAQVVLPSRIPNEQMTGTSNHHPLTCPLEDTQKRPRLPALVQMAPLNNINSPSGDLMIFSPTPSAPLTNPPLSQALKGHQGIEGGEIPLLVERSSRELPAQVNGHTGAATDRDTESGRVLGQQKIGDKSHNSNAELRQSLSRVSRTNTGGQWFVPTAETMVLRPVEQSELAFAEQRQSVSEESIEVSEEVVAPAKCVGPDCREFVLPPERLCHSCQAVLIKAKNSAQGKDNPETTPGAEKSQPEQATGKSHSGGTEKPRVVESKVTSTKRHRGEPCITPGCQRFGDPANSYMCSTCYTYSQREYQKLRRAAARDWSVEVRTPLEQGAVGGGVQRQWSKMVTSKTSLGEEQVEQPKRNSMHLSLEDLATPESFTQQYNRLHTQTKAGLKNCRVAGCPSYGNPSRSGFCNACYTLREKRRQQELIAKYGENVPDCVSSRQNSL